MPIPRRPRVNYHFKIDHVLSPRDRSAYEKLLRDPATTVDSAHAWLTARGCAVSRSAVARHRRHTLLAAQASRQKVIELRELHRLTEGPDRTNFTDSARVLMEYAAFEVVRDFQNWEQVPIPELLRMAKMINELAGARLRLLKEQQAVGQAKTEKASPAAIARRIAEALEGGEKRKDE